MYKVYSTITLEMQIYIIYLFVYKTFEYNSTLWRLDMDPIFFLKQVLGFRAHIGCELRNE